MFGGMDFVRVCGFRVVERECDGGCMRVAGAGGVSGRGPGGGSFVGSQQARISGPDKQRRHNQT